MTRWLMALIVSIALTGAGCNRGGEPSSTGPTTTAPSAYELVVREDGKVRDRLTAAELAKLAGTQPEPREPGPSVKDILEAAGVKASAGEVAIAGQRGDRLTVPLADVLARPQDFVFSFTGKKTLKLETQAGNVRHADAIDVSTRTAAAGGAQPSE